MSALIRGRGIRCPVYRSQGDSPIMKTRDWKIVASTHDLDDQVSPCPHDNLPMGECL
jgi:hypothetical protein